MLYIDYTDTQLVAFFVTKYPYLKYLPVPYRELIERLGYITVVKLNITRRWQAKNIKLYFNNRLNIKTPYSIKVLTLYYDNEAVFTVKRRGKLHWLEEHDVKTVLDENFQRICLKINEVEDRAKCAKILPDFIECTRVAKEVKADIKKLFIENRKLRSENSQLKQELRSK